jgi:hypothetical protein
MKLIHLYQVKINLDKNDNLLSFKNKSPILKNLKVKLPNAKKTEETKECKLYEINIKYIYLDKITKIIKKN